MKIKDMNLLLDLLKKEFELEEVDINEYRNIKIKSMKFNISQYEIKGVGNLSIMTCSAMLGLMKMNTLMLTPKFKDMPLFSYDRVYALGNDTIMLEAYNTCVGDNDYHELEEIKEKYKNYPDHELEKCWYEDIKLPITIVKKGKKCQEVFDNLACEYMSSYIKLLKNASSVDEKIKNEKNLMYVQGLLDNGGPSTNVFINGIGREKTEYLFKHILFNVGE